MVPLLFFFENFSIFLQKNAAVEETKRELAVCREGDQTVNSASA
jgi:hypothetical protein